MIKNLIYIVLLIAIGCAGWFCLQKIETQIASEQEKLAIERTENMVENVRQLAQFTTACFYQEAVVRSTKQAEWSKGVTGSALRAVLGKENSATTDEIVLITKGSVRAGFNMENLSETDLTVMNDTIIIHLPKPEIFDIIINPSDYDVFIENGTWTHEQLSAIVAEAQSKMRSDAISAGIYKHATESCETKLKQLFHILGFNTIMIE